VKEKKKKKKIKTSCALLWSTFCVVKVEIVRGGGTKANDLKKRKKKKK
jgi:hypothetical protein